MLSAELQKVADQAKRLYEANWQSALEAEHAGKFVCIEPVSGDYFLGSTFDQAVNQALDAHPTRLTHTLRIGHAAALHLGVLSQ